MTTRNTTWQQRLYLFSTRNLCSIGPSCLKLALMHFSVNYHTKCVCAPPNSSCCCELLQKQLWSPSHDPTSSVLHRPICVVGSWGDPQLGLLGESFRPTYLGLFITSLEVSANSNLTSCFMISSRLVLYLHCYFRIFLILKFSHTLKSLYLADTPSSHQ